MNDKMYHLIRIFLTKNPVMPWRIGNWIGRTFFYGNVNINNAKHWDERFANLAYDANKSELKLRKHIISQISKNDNVLDVGCGDAVLLNELKKKKFKNLAGLDISKVAIENLKKAGILGKVSKLPEVPFPMNSFDVVIATEVLEHIPADKKTVQNMLGVVKPGGFLFVSVPNNCMGPDIEPEHLRKYTRHDLKRLLKDLKNLKFKVFEPRILAYGYKK